MPQRRVDLRARVSVPVQILGEDRSSVQATIETIDISAGGAFCRAPEEVPLRSQIHIRIDLPTEEPGPPILTDAIVLRVDRDAQSKIGGFLVGLYFLNLSFEDRRRLQQFIFNWLESEASPA